MLATNSTTRVTMQLSLIPILLASIASASVITRSGTPLTDAQANARLSAAGITRTSSGGCTAKSNPTCTSYEGLLSGTVDAAITLKGACGCALTITGGTEVGHTTSGTYRHDNGYKLDFHHVTALDNYIHNAFTKIGNRGDGYPQWQAASGNIYCDEGTHWDVTVY